MDISTGFSGGISGKESACQCRRHKRCRFVPWVRKIPWRRAWQPASVFLPGESHGQRRLVGCSPPAPNPSQHQGLFQWVNSLHEVAKGLEFQLQHQSFQWTPRTDSEWPSVQVSRSVVPLCDPMNRSTPGLPVHHQLPESTQTHVHWVSDAIQPSHPLPSPFPPAPNPSQCQSFPMSQLFAWGGQSTGVSALASFLPKNTQGWSPLEWTGWISLQSKGLSRVFSNTTVQKHQFFSA